MDAQTVPGKMKETARDKFLRLAPPRVDAALRKIRLLGNLAGRGYEYELAEAKQIIEALTGAIDDLERKFSKSKSGKPAGFVFKRK